MRENIRSRERVKLFFNFIVFSFGVPKPGNYRKFRTCFMRVKISRVNQQRKLLTKSLLWALPTHHECETKSDGVSKGPTINTRRKFSLRTMPSPAITSYKEAKFV